MLGHDLRLALTDVVGGLQIVDEAGLPPDSRRQLDRVRASSELLGRLLDETLELASEQVRHKVTVRSPIAISRLLEDVESRWRGHAEAKGIGFRIFADETVPDVILSDRLALDRILSNLISNAIKNTVSGEVSLAVDVRPGNELRMRVRDQGPGFSDAAIEALFLPNQAQDARKSTGLGLKIARQSAETIGGRLSVANGEKDGAEVTLMIPEDHWIIDPALVPEQAPPELKGLKVLVAEDNRTSQIVVSQMLEVLGVTVELVDNGADAVDRLSQQHYDACLLDIEMPGLNGRDVIRRVRSGAAGDPRLPILAITAYATSPDRQAITDAGADGILAKPIIGMDGFGRALAAVTGRARDRQDGDAMAVAHGTDLQRILALQTAEGKDALLKQIVADLEDCQSTFREAVSPPDFAAIRAVTHVLISLAGTIGAIGLQSSATRLNAAAHAGDAALVETSAVQILQSLEAVIDAVKTKAERAD